MPPVKSQHIRLHNWKTTTIRTILSTISLHLPLVEPMSTTYIVIWLVLCSTFGYNHNNDSTSVKTSSIVCHYKYVETTFGATHHNLDIKHIPQCMFHCIILRPIIIKSAFAATSSIHFAIISSCTHPSHTIAPEPSAITSS